MKIWLVVLREFSNRQTDRQTPGKHITSLTYCRCLLKYKNIFSECAKL